MKKTISLVFAVLFLALCAVPSLGLLITGGSGAAANQLLAAKPSLVKRGGEFNADVLKDLAAYVDDRFFLRQEAVTLWAELNAGLLRSSVTDQVLLGQDGWLYYTPTLADYARSEPMTPRELWCAARRLYLLQEYVEARGGQFLFTAAPNKNSLYPAHMPALPREEIPSNAELLQTVLDGMGVHTLDLFAVFRAEDEELYFPRDSHWNGRGAALAADAILGALGRESGYFNGDFAEGAHRGDLYEMLFPAGSETDPDLVYAAGFTFSADSENPDSITIRTQSAAGNGSLLMYRDSFGRSLYPYLAEAYSDALFSRKTDYDPTALEPGGTLVIELVERNLRYLLDYTPSLPAAERGAALTGGAVLAGELRCVLKKGGPEGYVVLSGAYGGRTPETDSPVYVQTASGLFEALPGPEGFSACLPESALQSPMRVFWYAEGTLLALDALVEK